MSDGFVGECRYNRNTFDHTNPYRRIRAAQQLLVIDASSNIGVRILKSRRHLCDGAGVFLSAGCALELRNKLWKNCIPVLLHQRLIGVKVMDRVPEAKTRQQSVFK